MRKKIQDHSGGNPKFFAQKKRVGKLVQTISVRDEYKFIDPTTLEQFTNLGAAEYSDEFQSPNVMAFDGTGKFLNGWAAADDGHMAHIECPMLGDFHQNDTIGNQEDVIDDQREDNDQAVRCIRLYKRN